MNRWIVTGLITVGVLSGCASGPDAPADTSFTCGAEDVVVVNSHTDDPSCVHIEDLVARTVCNNPDRWYVERTACQDL
jgi:hypothetical protein